MKKLILAALAASVVATPVLAAPYQGYDDRGRIEQRHDDRGSYDRGDYRGTQPPQVQYRQWNSGQRFDNRQAQDYRAGYDRRDYRDHRSGSDALAIGIAGGLVAAVVASLIH